VRQAGRVAAQEFLQGGFAGEGEEALVHAIEQPAGGGDDYDEPMVTGNTLEGTGFLTERWLGRSGAFVGLAGLVLAGLMALAWMRRRQPLKASFLRLGLLLIFALLLMGTDPVLANPSPTPTVTATPGCGLDLYDSLTLTSGAYSYCYIHVYSGGYLEAAGAVTFTVASDFTVDAGGLVTMDWHAPSCNAAAHAGGGGKPLATVNVNGRDVVIQPAMGGSSFYAEDEYTHAITSRADVPETVKCLCQIANDQPLTAGTYRGLSGKTWLIAHAKHAAQVMREQGLAGAPVIVRPFHEQTGPWFWWGQAYWSCSALLGKPEAISGPEAYKEMARTFITALRAEPGMDNLLFAYSPDRLLGAREQESFSPVQDKVTDPTGYARDLLRNRMVHELDTAGLLWSSAAQARATMRAAEATSARRANDYVAQRRPFYTEAYAGDDLFDLLGIDLYHPAARAANAADLRLFGLQLRVVADEARARGKPYALTEAGTYRLHLAELARRATRGQPLVINGKQLVDDALAMLFDPAARAQLLRHFGLTTAGPVTLDDAERAAVLPRTTEDWYTRQLLPLARQAKVAYALVWQTYYDSTASDRYAYYYVPFPGHPDAPSFQRFYDDPATCFLRDGCGR